MFKYIENNKKVRLIEIILCILFSICFLACLFIGIYKTNYKVTDYKYIGEEILYRDIDIEDYSIDNKICEITYIGEEGKLILSYSYIDYLNINDEYIKAYKYECADKIIYLDNNNPSIIDLNNELHSILADEYKILFSIAISLLLIVISILVILLFGLKFSTYEKIWFISIMFLSCFISILYPEENANGISGIVIMLLYLLDTFLNILCELLISKQSKYNFLISVLVEITEILICLVLMYRFATLAVTLLFWLPIDIISYINWSKHIDDIDEDLTIVRRLKGWQELLIIVVIFIWTFVIGYFISGLDIKTDFLNSDKLETIIIYLDAFASAAGICNGLFIFFRLQEQWYAWYLCSLIETIINILSGQYVLLVLKLGYFTNTTYGYLKWKKYIDNSKLN